MTVKILQNYVPRMMMVTTSLKTAVDERSTGSGTIIKMGFSARAERLRRNSTIDFAFHFRWINNSRPLDD